MKEFITCREKRTVQLGELGEKKSTIHYQQRLHKITKAKLVKWDDIKLKGSAQQRKTINKAKRQPREWKKILVNYTSNKGLVSKIYKELNSTERKQPEQMFLKTRCTNPESSNKVFSITINKMHIKTAMRYYLTPVKMAVDQKDERQ